MYGCVCYSRALRSPPCGGREHFRLLVNQAGADTTMIQISEMDGFQGLAGFRV